MYSLNYSNDMIGHNYINSTKYRVFLFCKTLIKLKTDFYRETKAKEISI